MKKFLLCLLVLSSAVLLAQQPPQVPAPHIPTEQEKNRARQAAIDEQAEQTRARVAEEQKVLPPAPVSIENNDLDLGFIYMMEQRDFQFVLTNTSDEPLVYKDIVINCSCTTSRVSGHGTIPPKGQLVIPLHFNAQKVTDFGDFIRDVIVFFDKYAAAVMYFRGNHTMDVKLTVMRPGDSRPHLVTSVPIGFVPDIYMKWFETINITAEFPKGTELEIGTPTLTNKQFTAEVKKVQTNHYQVVVRPVLPMEYGPIRGSLRIPLVKPSNQGYIMLPLNGTVGTLISCNTDYVYIDPKTEHGVVTKILALTRFPYENREALIARAMGNPNPYMRFVEILEPKDMKTKEAPGVKFTYTQGKGGVYVHCAIDTDKMTEEGVDVVFEAVGSAPCTVKFARMTEELRKTIEEQEKIRQEMEKEEQEEEEQNPGVIVE
jgi:hypothetical protein